MSRKIDPETTAKLLAWKKCYETDHSISVRKIADDIGTSHAYVQRQVKLLNWAKAPNNNKALTMQRINSYKLQYETDSSLTVRKIATALDIPYHVVRDWITKNKWVACPKTNKANSVKTKKVKIIKEASTTTNNSNAKQLAKFSSIFNLANSLTDN